MNLSPGPATRRQKVGLLLAAVLYIVAGTLHFLKTGVYARIVPPWIPYPVTMVLVSGVFEILGGVGLLIPPIRWAAALGLIALLIAVFPANVFMATNPAAAGAASIPPALLWLRLPLQVLLIWWLVWCARPRRYQSSFRPN